MSGKIGIVVAMEREVAPLVGSWQRSTVRIGQRDVAVYESTKAVLVCGGIGKAAAGLAARWLVQTHAPRILISAGLSGSTHAELKPPRVILPTTVVDERTGTRFLTAIQPKYAHDVVLVTAESVAEAADKRALAERLNAVAVEMEAAAVALVAQQAGVPFVAVKAISDELEFPMLPFARFVSADGELQVARFALHLAVHPQWWKPARELQKRAQAAAVELSKRLQEIVDTPALVGAPAEDWAKAR